MKTEYFAGLFFLWLALTWPVNSFGTVHEFVAKGDRALSQNNAQEAEHAFSKALELDTGNYRVLRSLAKVKVKLGKFKEAETLIAKILSMEVSTQKKVLVKFLDGDGLTMKAELIDETVIPGKSGKNNMRNYLKSADVEVIPHYRLFFIESGEMKLIPKNKVQIKYMAVPRMIHDEMLELQAKVRNKLIIHSKAKKTNEMVTIKGGCFPMGSERGAPLEQPVHEVCVSSFKLDVFEVTQEKFLREMDHNPSLFQGANRPVDSVTWAEADAYCQKLKKRLPTEAEWENAARAGTTTEYYWGDGINSKQANFCDSSCGLNIKNGDVSDGFKHTAPVGSFSPNPFGLYDMAGNVSEWVSDWIMENYYRASPKDNPAGPKYGEWKVVRGGAWENNRFAIRSSNRKGFHPGYRIEGVGFRCAADHI